MEDGFAGRVVLCWPSDRTEIDRLNAHVGQDHKFEPTVEHTLARCDSCNCGIWIGPQQLQLTQSVLIRARKLCFFCVHTINRTMRMNLREADVGPEIRFSRKRRA